LRHLRLLLRRSPTRYHAVLVHEFRESSALLRRVEPVLDAELGIQIAQVPTQGVDVEIDAVLGELAEDLVIGRWTRKPLIAVEIWTTERRQNRQVSFGHADNRADAPAGF
jgi:hypothetical protein